MKIEQILFCCGMKFKITCLSPLTICAVEGLRLAMFGLIKGQDLVFEERNSVSKGKYWFRPEEYTVGGAPYIGGFIIYEQGDEIILDHTIP